MDPRSVWHINQNICQLDDQQFKTSLQLDKPSLGLINTEIFGKPLGNRQFLKIIQRDEKETTQVSDCFIRASDLAVTFARHQESSVQPQVYWRYTRFQENVFLVDVVISVETSLLASDPTISLQSNVQQAQLFDWNERGLDAIEWGDRQTLDCPRGMAICRFVDANVSFMTAVHPSDFESMRFERKLIGSEEQTVLSLVLFQHGLEKGVIRRGRVRGAFLPAENEVELAERLMEDFVLQPPPLTT